MRGARKHVCNVDFIDVSAFDFSFCTFLSTTTFSYPLSLMISSQLIFAAELWRNTVDGREEVNLGREQRLRVQLTRPTSELIKPRMAAWTQNAGVSKTISHVPDCWSGTKVKKNNRKKTVPLLEIYWGNPVNISL